MRFGAFLSKYFEKHFCQNFLRTFCQNFLRNILPKLFEKKVLTNAARLCIIYFVADVCNRQSVIEYTEKYSRGRRGAPAKGVGRVYRRESSNLSFSAKKDRQYRKVLPVFFVEEMYIMQDSANCRRRQLRQSVRIAGTNRSAPHLSARLSS